MPEKQTSAEIVKAMLDDYSTTGDGLRVGPILEVREMRAICELLQELQDIKACIGWFQIQQDAALARHIDPALLKGHTFPVSYREDYKNHNAEEGSQDDTPHDTKD